MLFKTPKKTRAAYTKDDIAAAVEFARKFNKQNTALADLLQFSWNGGYPFTGVSQGTLELSK